MVVHSSVLPLRRGTKTCPGRHCADIQRVTSSLADDLELMQKSIDVLSKHHGSSEQGALPLRNLAACNEAHPTEHDVLIDLVNRYATLFQHTCSNSPHTAAITTVPE